MSDTITEAPPAWTELVQALTLLATHASNDTRPFHCDHDVLTVMADPAEFTAAELAQLDAWGFHRGEEGTFYSYRFGSA